MRYFSLCWLLALPASLFAAQFNGGVGAAWEFISSAGHCTLQQRVGDYGVARFGGAQGEPLYLEVLAHRELFGAGALEVLRVAPPWHADHPASATLGRLEHLAGTGVRVVDPLATQVLMSLYDGYDARLAHTPWYLPTDSERVEVQIGSAGLRPLYEDFVHCAQGAPVPAWSDVSKTRIDYPTNVWSLTPDAETKLERVARYVRADAWVSGVFVDGHTDAFGTQQGNYRLSQRRAEVVRDRLVAEGVDPELLTVRFHGAAYPVADNESETGRAQNRRTTVRLERRWPELARADDP